MHNESDDEWQLGGRGGWRAVRSEELERRRAVRRRQQRRRARAAATVAERRWTDTSHPPLHPAAGLAIVRQARAGRKAARGVRGDICRSRAPPRVAHARPRAPRPTAPLRIGAPGQRQCVVGERCCGGVSAGHHGGRAGRRRAGAKSRSKYLCSVSSSGAGRGDGR